TRCLEGFDGFVTSTAAPIATGWSDQLSGRESHPLEIRALARRTAPHTPRRVIRPVRGRDQRKTADEETAERLLPRPFPISRPSPVKLDGNRVLPRFR